MPNGWVHATHTLVAFGRPYFDDHRQKDAAWRLLGSQHRLLNHDYYWELGISWTLETPFPSTLNVRIEARVGAAGAESVEREQALASHDYMDRVWDTLNRKQRKWFEGAMLWLLVNPDFLSRWAGLDLVEGGIQRFSDAREIWEPCPQLRSEYHRLRAYAEAVRRKDPLLRHILAVCG